MSPISAVDNHPRSYIAVADSEMAYVDVGEGDPVVFLHGNPTSSYLWRNVIAHVSGVARCLAPDLIGMGQSGKSGTGKYRFEDHRRYLDAWFDVMDLGDRITLVLHDWGSALGFHWFHRHPERVKGIAYMEAIVMPVTWDDWPEGARRIFQGMRSEAGEDIVLNKNAFIERILPSSILRQLSEEEMDVYRAPFVEGGELRRPMLTWPREIPIEGQPPDVHAVVEAYGAFLHQSEAPKLFINAEPGAILIGRQREYCRTWPNQIEITVKGGHFLQEDAPDEIGEAVRNFVLRINAIRLEQFEALEPGMRYEEVVGVLGREGTLLSENVAQFFPGIDYGSMATEIYEWTNYDGSALRVMFSRSKLREKTQNGLW